MEIFFHISWRRSSGGHFCDQSIIESGTLVSGGGSLVCDQGCSGTVTGLQYRCTDFSVEENWSFGERRFSYSFIGGPIITVEFTGSAWISPFSSSWRVSTTFSLTRRNDTGRINSTPRAITSPVIRIQESCNHTIRIPVTDPDDDIVRCRWAVGDECGGICSRFPGAILDNMSCSIFYNANQGTGFRAAAIMIEDFLPGSADPLSSVGLQFLVLVVDTERSCSANPSFISPTLPDGSCVAIPSGETFHARLVAVSGYVGDTISEIQTVSPAGLHKSSVFPDENSDAFYVNITWTPTPDQQNNSHLFCYTATNSGGLSSSQVCVELLSGLTAPTPIQESATPNMESVYPFNTTWCITFDKLIERPSITAYVTFHDSDTDVVVYEINTTSSSEIEFKNGNQIILTPNYIFEEKKEYYINLDRAVVVGLEGCGPGNEPVYDRYFWTFTTRDITPPAIIFLNNPTISNGNISITWESNEEVMWHCILYILNAKVEQECSGGFWSGSNLQGGTYSLQVSATDLANNTATATHVFTVDDIPPIVTFTQVPPLISNLMNAFLQFQCFGEICNYQCRFYEEDDENDFFTQCYGIFTTPSLLHGKQYTLIVTATDEVGNVGQPTGYTWETDFEAPIISGVANTSGSCTSNLSPTDTGQAQAVDDRPSGVTITFYDQRMTCSIARTWRAVDAAGNEGIFVQYIALEYQAALNYLPQLSLPCDSTTPSVSVTGNTATLPNPCIRPLRLSFEDTGSNTCPGIIMRTWTLFDDCTQTATVFEQTITLFDVCSFDACGRNESPPRGICIQGNCICSRSWFGENCDTYIRSVQVMPVDDHILQELTEYSETLNITDGTPPLIITLISSPTGMVVSQESRQITWSRAQAGNYTITVEVGNQVSTVRVSWLLIVRPGYTATLQPVMANVFPRPTPLVLNGEVEYFEGNSVMAILNGFVPVKVEIRSRNGKRELTTFSQQDGTFAVLFYPASTEYGSYVTGAKHPTALTATEQTSWDFLGMSAVPHIIQLRDSTVAYFEKTFHNVSTIINDGPQTLNGITAVAALAGTDQLSITIIIKGHSTLRPNQTAYIDIEVIATGALEATVPVKIQSIEGVTLYLSLRLSIAKILPELVANPPSIKARVIRGMAHSIDFNISNAGIIPAHMVRAVLPISELFSLVSFGNAVQENKEELILGSGESARLSVLVTIPQEQPLGEISGQIVIYSMETFLTIRFDLLISSNILMNLTVLVEDEYTYFAEGQPLVSDAVVLLTNNIRGIRESFTTGESGTVKFMNIPEDQYELFVSGPNHADENQIIIISAEEPIHIVFLARRAVTYTFSVVPTTFDETYTVTLEADFVTHVPIPVVTITPTEVLLEPYELGLEDTIQYNITNHGLIRADDVSFDLPTGHPFLEFTTDIEDIGSLDALTSIIVPVKVTRIDGREKRNIGSCVGALLYVIGIAYHYVCGDLQRRTANALLRGLSHFADCDFGIGLGGGGRFRLIGWRDPIHPDSTSSLTTYTPTKINCIKCLTSVVGCIPFPINYFSCYHLIFSTGVSIVQSGLRSAINFRDLADIFGLLGCALSFVPISPVASVVISALLCFPGVLRDCFRVSTTFRRKRHDIASTAEEAVPYIYAMHELMLLGVEVFGDERWVRVVADPTWLSEVFQPIFSDASDGGPLISVAEFNSVTSLPPPRNATREMVEALLQRLNNTYIGWNNGTLEPENGANMVSYGAVQNFSRNINFAQEEIGLGANESFLDTYNEVIQEYNMIFESDEEEEGVCAVVRIRIEQEIALTRDAFLAILEIENMEVSDLEQVQMEFHITAVNSSIESTHLFSIGNETLTGSLKLGPNGWVLPSSGSGAAEWLIVPLSGAAPTENQDYDIGGRFSYVANNENISVPLLPTRITVAPDPSLIIHYFWEKYVVGDNPFTDEKEPSIPFVLGVAIHNAGYGTAMDLRITSGQPEIIENEKGLLVTFKIIGTRIGSERVTPSLTVDFGDIHATETKVARWLLISSLQGEFMNYSASFEYMNPLGDPRLSVLDELVIHDLIRNVQIFQEGENDGVLDFLVNDESDLYNFPDALYSTKTFTRYNVSTGIIEALTPQDPEHIEVQAVSNYSGWVYFRFEDVGNVFSEIKQNINFSKSLDGDLPQQNAWVAGESQPRPGKAEKFFLHIIDYFDEAGAVTYILRPCTSGCSTDEQPFESVTPPGKEEN